MSKYQSLNVLANQKKASDYMSDDVIENVANMIKSSGANRSQRKRLERSLRKTSNILAHAQKHVDDSAYKEYQRCVDSNYLHFFAILILVASEDYNWKEDDTHNQISSLLKRVDNKIKKYANMGLNTDDLLKLVEEKYDMILVPENH